ncbi:flagellar assembly protein FliH [Vibrio agarivorans]|uniref:flagellar assembly protein FliH n=1 Tax=Vibrio agarivorans TaxID=153622 RepID=UPI00222E8690|nr:flagellar assembly protein FliH [Vibrio agarivorans]
MSRRNRIMRLEPHQYRSFRFPPIVEPSALNGAMQPAEPSLDDEFGLGEFTGFDEFDVLGSSEEKEDFSDELETSESVSGDIQQQYSQGFQLGMTKGYDEGVKEGLEKGQAQGFEQGLLAGHEQGVEQGKLEGKKAFLEAAVPFVAMTDKLKSLFTEQERRQREQVCELVRKVSQQVIRCELTLQPQQILALVEETLETLPSEPVGIKVMMAQEEFSQIEQVAAEKIDQWNIVCDPSLRQGDCRIVTKTAEADAGCDQRLETCMQSVQKHLLEEPANEQAEMLEPSL